MNIAYQILELLEFHQTAISRKTMSVPTRYLVENDLIKGDVLDFGCGRGFDTDELGAVGYDPNSEDYADFPTNKFDTIVCNYVLNVVPPDVQNEIIEQIKSLMKDDAIAYISVRRDVDKDPDPENQTQWYVELPFEVLKENSSFCLYKMTL